MNAYFCQCGQPSRPLPTTVDRTVPDSTFPNADRVNFYRRLCGRCLRQFLVTGIFAEGLSEEDDGLGPSGDEDTDHSDNDNEPEHGVASGSAAAVVPVGEGQSVGRAGGPSFDRWWPTFQHWATDWPSSSRPPVGGPSCRALIDPRKARSLLPYNVSRSDGQPYKVRAHRLREQPQLFLAHKPCDLRALARDEGPEPEINFEKMHEWLNVRGISDRYQSVTEQPFPWAAVSGSEWKGKFFRAVLKPECVYPPLTENLVGARMDSDGHIEIPDNAPFFGSWPSAIHTSSMYSHWKISTEGLAAGPSFRMGLRGVYCFPLAKDRLAVKASAYAVHSELFEDSIYWTPMYELQVARFMGGAPCIGKISAGDQWVCKTAYSPTFGPMWHCAAVWYRAVCHTDCAEAAKQLWISLDRFLPEYEQEPSYAEQWNRMLLRSSAARRRT